MVSINIPSVDLIERVDFCGLVSGSKTDKSQVFESFYESNDKIPVIDECPTTITCKVIKALEVYNNIDVFIGEVMETLVREDCTTNAHADTKKINPLIYCTDNMYWSIGDTIGNGFNIGKDDENR